MLKAINISKSFGTTIALDNVSGVFNEGSITAVIGPSGGGKSTLLKALSMLEDPDSGEILCDGQHYQFPEKKGNPPPLWPELTVVFQQLFLWPHLTLRENILLPLKSLGREEAIERSNKVIERIGIRSFVDRFPNEVSLGQRQLSAIARSVALQPRYLLLDEVTSSLDVEYIRQILRWIEDLKDQGVTIILVSHLLPFVKRSADQVMFLEDGVAVETGGVEIMTNPSSRRLKKFIEKVDFSEL